MAAPRRRRVADPIPSSPEALRRMKATRQRDTVAEMRVRRLVHSQGLRYRIDVAPLPGFRRKADLVFPSARLAVFIDGCFWHGCPLHGTQAKSNAAFWHDKIETNR